MALVWIALMLSCFSAMAQEKTADDPFGTPKPSVKFTILLGPDFKTEERPFCGRLYAVWASEAIEFSSQLAAQRHQHRYRDAAARLSLAHRYRSASLN